MKKVLFIATVVKLHIMVFHVPYLEWFRKNGYEVHVAAKNDYLNKDECNIPFCDVFFDLPFERIPIKRNNLYVYNKLKKIIDNNEYEIIHCHTPMGGTLGRLAARKARKDNTKVIYTAHGFHFFKGAPLINWLTYYPAERLLARYTDVIITINTEDYKLAKSFKSAKVEFVPGVGIDTNKFINIKVNRLEKRKSIGIEIDDFMIISVGELNKNKNHQVIIKAISKLKNKKVKYVICGEGLLEDELKRMVNELDIENQVKFLGFRKDIPDIMNIADLFAFPSFREGLSLSLMEAMASGLQVVCSKIRGNIDLIEEGKGGFLVDPGDEDGFLECIKEMIDNYRLRNELGDFNLKKIMNYSIENVLINMEDIYLVKKVDNYESTTCNK